MLKTKKQSSISVMQRSAKCIGLTEINEQTLKGNIHKYLHTLEQSNLKNKKIYVNALRNFYSCVDFDQEEMEYLNTYFTDQCKTTDTERKETKEKMSELHYFYTTMSDLREIREMWKRSYLETKRPHQLAHWLIIALYCDEDFGAKRPVDICNLKRSNIQGDRIVFTAQKNNFKYESQPLSEHILEPLRAVLDSHSKEAVLVNPNTGKAYTPEIFYKLLKKALWYGVEVTNVNAQYLRRMWASYKYSQHPTARELLRHSYELNHNCNTHLEDYVLEYKIYKVLGVYNFRKVVSSAYVRC